MMVDGFRHTGQIDRELSLWSRLAPCGNGARLLGAEPLASFDNKNPRGRRPGGLNRKNRPVDYDWVAAFLDFFDLLVCFFAVAFFFTGLEVAS